MVVLGWAWRHYSLEVDRYDSIDAAVGVLGYSSDMGECATDRIEVWHDDGTHEVIDDIYDRWKEIERARKAAMKPSPPVVASFAVKHPEKPAEVAYLDSAWTEESAAKMTADLAVLGDRLVITRPSR